MSEAYEGRYSKKKISKGNGILRTRGIQSAAIVRRTNPPVQVRTNRGDLDRNRAFQYSAVNTGVACAPQITTAITCHVSATIDRPIVFVHMPDEPRDLAVHRRPLSMQTNQLHEARRRVHPAHTCLGRQPGPRRQPGCLSLPRCSLHGRQMLVVLRLETAR